MIKNIKKHVINFYDSIFKPLFVVSYPKAGRTWFRLMISSSIKPDVDLDSKAEITKLTRFSKKFKTVIFSHTFFKEPQKISELRIKGSLVILIRDPRDIVVSSFYEHTKRTGGFNKRRGLTDFIRDEIYGISNIVAFYNSYLQHHNDKTIMIVRYEDLHSRPVAIIKEFLSHITRSYYSEEKINSAVENCKFSILQKKSFTSLNPRLRPYKKNDTDSQKFREGKVGSYQKYFSKEDILYLNSELSKLSPVFGYTEES